MRDPCGDVFERPMWVISNTWNVLELPSGDVFEKLHVMSNLHWRSRNGETYRHVSTPCLPSKFMTQEDIYCHMS